MDINASHEQPDGATDHGVQTWLRKQVTFLLMLAAILFLTSGRLDWALGWVQLGLYTTTVVAQAFVLIPKSPELISERSRLQQGTKNWDVVLASLAAVILPMTTWIVAGLDVRFGWSPPMTLALVLGAVPVFGLGWAITIWAMASNPFFSATVRIQKDRGQTVVSRGPYRYLRHPGYAGAILFQLAVPLTLASWWALIPSGLAALLYIVRTILEDKTLQTELEGYRQYARQVRYRLLPGIW